MEVLSEWELAIIHAIQLARDPVLDVIFQAATHIGDEVVLVILLAVLYWCVNHVVGARLAVAYLVSSYFSEGLKELIARPRPFEYDLSVQLVDPGAMVYGMPSNHAQASVFLWGIVATRGRKAWVWGVAALMVVLIGFSRVYLGVHYPTDVLVGWALGAVFLAVYLGLGQRFEAWLGRARLEVQLALAIVVPVVLALLHSTRATVALMAPLLGIGAGVALAARVAPFSPAGPLWQRALRLLVGAVPLAAIYLGLRFVFPGEGEPLYEVTRFVRYGLMGLWAGLGAPWLFLRLRLAMGGQARASAE